MATTALVRNPAKLTVTHADLTVVPGELSDPEAIEQAIKGADAVISALGPTLKRSASGTPVTGTIRSGCSATTRSIPR